MADVDFLNARVIYKVATEAEWNAITLDPLIKGEIYFYNFPGDANKIINLKIGDGVRQPKDLPYMWDASIRVPFFGSATPSSSPSPASGDGFWIVSEEGTYTNYGGVVLPANSLGVITRVGGAYSIVVSTIDLSGYALENTPDGQVIRSNDRATLEFTSQDGGYYRYNTGVFTAAGNYHSRLYTLPPGSPAYATGTISGAVTALAVFFDVNMTYLGYYIVGPISGTSKSYSNEHLPLPSGTAFIGTSTTDDFEDVIVGGDIATDPAFKGGLNKTLKEVYDELSEIKADEVNENGTVIRSNEKNEVPFTQQPSGYYRYNNGVFTSTTFHVSRLYDILGITDRIYATGRISGSLTSLAVYFDASMTFLGYQFQGPSGSNITEYTNQLLTLPANTRYIGTSNLASLGNTILGYGSRDDVAFKGGYDGTLEDLYDELSAGSKNLKGKTVGFAGDSITAAANRWTQVFRNIMQPDSYLNVAIGSSRWSKSANFNGTGVASQDFSDPDFAGMAGSTGTTQQQANNCAVNHIKNFFATAEFIPDVFILAYGTNPDETIGNTTDALAGKTISSDDTFTMANAVRWCIQAIQNEYPNCKVFISLPIHSADPSKNTLLNDTKNPIIATIAKELSVPVIDCYGEVGINEKFETVNAAGRWLQDGLHPNEAGGVLMGTYIANRVSTYL